MQITVKNQNLKIVFELNNSEAAKDLAMQSPLTLDIKNFSNNEKIFYPPKKLPVNKTSLARAQAGELCYYAPWGDVVMFYRPADPNPELYSLGKVISGQENIAKLQGSVTLTLMLD